MSSVSGSDKADMDDVTACRDALDLLNENMGIIGKVGGSGSIPLLVQELKGGIDNHISSCGDLFTCRMPCC